MRRCFVSVVLTLVAVSPALSQDDALPRKGAFGAALGPASTAESQAAGVKTGIPVKVTRVAPGMTAAALDVKVGDILVSFGDVPFTGPSVIQAYIKKNLSDVYKRQLSGRFPTLAPSSAK